MSGINKLICGASTTNQMIETVNACVDGSKALDGIKALEPIEGVTLNVAGFYAGSAVGGGQFIYNATLSKVVHNGGTFIAPEAIEAWDGTSADIATLLGWTGAGVGCFVRLGDNLVTTPATFGQVGSRVDVNAATGLALVDHAWDKNRLILGDFNLWVDELGELRISRNAPTGDEDGVNVSTALPEKTLTALKSVGGMYYDVSRVEIPASTDFTWEMDLAPNAADFQLLGDSTATDETGQLTLSGANYIGFGSTFAAASTAWRIDGKLHKMIISRVSNALTITVDGVLDGSTTYAGAFSFNGLGRKFGGTSAVATYNGIFFYSKLSVPSSKILNHEYRFDDKDFFLVDYNARLGAEMWNDVDIYIDPSWTNNLNGSYTKNVDTFGSIGFAVTEVDLATGDTYYRVEFTVTGRTTNPSEVAYIYTRNVSDTANIEISPILTDGDYSVTVKAGSKGLWFDAVNLSGLVLSNVSVKKALRYGRAVNVSGSDRELYKKNLVDNKWVGQTSGKIIEVVV